MFSRHMGVNSLAITEDLHTHPANVHLTLPALHMIATPALLNQNRAIRTLLDVISLRPTIQ